MSVSSVDIDYLNRVSLDSIYLEDQQGDTLAFIEKLEVKVSLLGLLKNELLITDASLTGADIQLRKDTNSEDFNFQFLIDAFSKDKSIDNKNALLFDLDKLNLENTHFSLKDDSTYLDVVLEKGTLNLESLDIDNKKIIANDLILENTQIQYNYEARSSQEGNKLQFPNLPWQIEIGHIKTQKVNLLLNEKNSQSDNSTLAFNNLYASDINFSAKNIKIDSTQINGQIAQLSLKEQCGFQLDNLQLDFNINEMGIKVPNLALETPHSKIFSSTTLTFEEFADLKNPRAIEINSVFDNSKISFKDLRYFSPFFSKNAFANISSQENIILDGDLKGDVQRLNFKDVTINVPGIINTRLNGHLSNLLAKDKFSFNMLVDRLQTSATKLSTVLPRETLPLSLNTFGNVDIKGKFTGTIRSFEVLRFDFNSEANTEAKFSGRITGIQDPKKLRLDLNIEQLHTHLDDIKGFIKGDLPTAIREAGAIHYSGDYKGSLKDFKLDGKLATDIGNAETDVALQFDNNYKGASYSGAVQLQDFDLGAVLNNDDFGKVSLAIDTDGAGLNINELNSKMNMDVASLSYKGIQYKNFTFKGVVDQKKINGAFNIDNTNVVAAFDGLLDLSGAEPEMNFVLDIDTLSMQPMNLSPQDIALSGYATIKGKGNSVDDFLGNIEIVGFNMRKETLTYHTDTLTLSSTMLETNKKELKLNTDGIEASISGEFNISQIPIYTEELIDDYIPIQWFDIAENTSGRSLKTKEIFTAKLEIENEDLLHLFIPKLNQLEDLSLYAYVNSEKESLFLNGSILSLSYDKFKSKNLDLFSQNKNNTIESDIIFEELTGIANFKFPQNSVHTVLHKDKLRLELDVQNDSLQNLLSLGGDLINKAGIYEFKFDEELQLDSTTWLVDKQNSIQFKKDYLFVNALSISKDLQVLLLQSDRDEPLGNNPLNVLLANFDIHELSNLMSLENDFLYGIADGNIIIRDVFTAPTYGGDLFAKDIVLNQRELGNVKVVAAIRDTSSILELSVLLDGKGNQLDGKGTLDLSNNALKFKSSFDNLDINLFVPYIEKIVSNSEGTINGDFIIHGTTKQPVINGKVKTNELSTLVNFSNTRYQLNNQEVSIEDSKFTFDNLLIKDTKDREAILNGAINHTRFKDFYYDLAIRTDSFQLLNTTSRENPLFYGDLILQADATIEGPLKLPQVKVDANSLSGTAFHLSPFAEAEAVLQDDYIIFTNNTLNANDSLQNIVYELVNDLPLDLELNLIVDKETEFQFILDPKSGDKLTCFGDANLQVEIAPDGQINVFGKYTIDSGKYNFSYGKLIYKEFDLAKGGSVIFQGDPLLARLNVAAEYNTKATPLAIVEDLSNLSDSEVSQLQKRSDIRVSLGIDGTIKQPDLNFDLAFQNNDIQLSPTIDRRINEIRNNEEELYNQVFGLILFDSFVATDNFSIAQSTGNIALSSISNLVEDRLNKFADKFIKGVELIVSVDSYNTNHIEESGSTSVTEFGLGASKSFFNNRLTLKALGNLDVDNRSDSAALSSIAGDFIIEYKLNKKGNITIEAFRKSDFDVLLEEDTNQNGVGISFQKALYLRNKLSE